MGMRDLSVVAGHGVSFVSLLRDPSAGGPSIPGRAHLPRIHLPVESKLH